MQQQNIVGYWRRWLASLINCGMIVITFGIYSIFLIINFIIGRASIGMKAVNMDYSTRRQLSLFLCSFLQLLFFILIIPIVINFFLVITKKGTYAERWSDNYYVDSRPGWVNSKFR
ncbi:hypothetical protein [[Acholeplasma] multilocale]|uniref:hypothetical protein n=1 Tax=[Acholeplasma] multilocale TaxID=264638 RepID=UPI00068709BF|nr:hypothetical protein [[Acholeplasma] multilocale]